MTPDRLSSALVAAMVLAVAPQTATAWGASGHRLIGRLATEALPADMPPFLRSNVAVEAVGELAREPDRWKGSGRTHDADRDPGHFLDLDDDGKVLGGPALGALPATRADYEAALGRVGADSWRAGYLPYSIIDGWQQLAKDFAYWRVEAAAAPRQSSVSRRRWMAADLARREHLILRDLGTLAHYVGDGSQPLHVSEHFNGWGPYPNPEGFTQQKVHAYFEGQFVRDHVSPAEVRTAMRPYENCHCSIEHRTEAYLQATNAQVTPFYRLEKAGAFSASTGAGRRFAAQRLAAGADELRDLAIDAWRASATGEVGFPPVKVGDVVAGRIDPYDSLYGLD